MSESHQPRLAFYQFEGICFYPEESRIVRIRDSSVFFVRPKERDFLVVLLNKPDQTITYEELCQEVWPETQEVKAVLPTIRETKRTLDKLLGDITKKPGKLIETVARQGYRLNADVNLSHDESSPLLANTIPSTFEPASAGFEVKVESALENQARVEQHSPAEVTVDVLARAHSPFGGHIWHVVTSCGIYAMLYSTALLLEIAYQFDRFGRTAMKLVPIIFIWMLMTSAGGLYADWKVTLQGKASGLAMLLLAFVGSAVALFAALIFFLPAFPITEISGSTFQSHTAQGAFLKDIGFYFIPLGIVFLALPFHFVASLSQYIKQRDHHRARDISSDQEGASLARNAIYLSVRTLGLVLFGAAFISLLLTFRLLDNIKAGPYRNLFTLLVALRVILYFALGLECLFWYLRTLNELRSPATGPLAR
jgi:DNA-binding winged helix-turn-helix (wHTH) protein